jgi:hypothetical protein
MNEITITILKKEVRKIEKLLFSPRYLQSQKEHDYRKLS